MLAALSLFADSSGGAAALILFLIHAPVIVL